MNHIDFKLKEKIGIYIFTNLINGKRYIGSSKNLYNRLHEHIHNLKNQKAHNMHFLNAWNKYGEESFIYGILEYCNIDDIFDRELFYLDLLKPEYNLTTNVVANFGHPVSQETKNKISNTLKEKYKNGEILLYRQEHLWIKTYIYNVRTWKLEQICNCRNDAFRLLKVKSTHFYPNKIYFNRYVLTDKEFKTVNDLKNYVYENCYQANSTFGKYIITEDDKLHYHKNLAECARDNFSSKGTLAKHSNATLNNPYIIRQSGRKFYYSNEYIKDSYEAVPIEKSSELSLGKIGESPIILDNPEVNLESKESKSPYSIEVEP